MPTRLAPLLALLLLSGLLLAPGFAHAASTPPTSAAPILESLSEDEAEEGEGEAEEGEEGECEAAEEELEEGELEPADVEEICAEEKAREKKEKRAKGSGANNPSIAPEECILRSAHGHASLFSHDDKLKLTIGYTTYEPVTAKLKIGHIATLHRHLGRSGVLRLVEGLPSNSTPKRLNVRIDIPSVKRVGCPFRRLVLFPR